MQDASQAPRPYSRSELEIELGRLALAIMRAAPKAFDLHAPEVPGPMTAERFRAVADELLSRTREEHRGFVIGRLRELADTSAGLRLEGFERESFAPPPPTPRAEQLRG